jgi:uncharacterized protein (TIGR00375 family)
MRIIADIHNHSRFSRACSPELTLLNLEKWGKLKGVNLLTTADFTHPVWIKECEEQLEYLENGFYKLKGSGGDVMFLFTTELAFIYKKGDKVRRVHNIVLAPHLQAVKKLNLTLANRGINLKSDGRPILGMSDRDFLELAKGVDEHIEVIPAHVWTPWFSIFGSKSGFDSVEECYGDMAQYIFALETGLSSDPEMNYQVSALDKYILISNSDSHSLKNIGREANVFEIDRQDLSYNEFIRILKEKDTSNFLHTLEFFPEEGRYHYDGHRDCGIVMTPQETKKEKGICPVCRKSLTIGVEYRVEELADRQKGFTPSDRPSYRKLIELDKIIAESLGVKSRTTKKVNEWLLKLIHTFGPELYILTELPLGSLTADPTIPPVLIEAIKRVREGRLHIQPGYDGVYGEVHIFTDKERVEFLPTQKVLF